MKKIVVRLFTLGSFCMLLLIIFLLNPCLAYDHVTTYKNITVYHSHDDLDENLKIVIDKSLAIIKEAKIYDATFQSDLCLNDGSLYPKVVRTILGDDVFTAFSNKVVVLGTSSQSFNTFYKWDKELQYTQFLSHGLLHNLQFKHHGLFGSNPLAQHPKWKWEGYVEYEAIGKELPLDTLTDLLKNKTLNDYDWISLPNGYSTIKQHIKYLAMTKYYLEVLGFDYQSFMKLDIDEVESYNILFEE